MRRMLPPRPSRSPGESSIRSRPSSRSRGCMPSRGGCWRTTAAATAGGSDSRHCCVSRTSRPHCGPARTVTGPPSLPWPPCPCRPGTPASRRVGGTGQPADRRGPRDHIECGLHSPPSRAHSLCGRTGQGITRRRPERSGSEPDIGSSEGHPRCRMERSGGMSMPTGPDPIDRLRAADPIRADEVPDASLARVSARIQEHIVTDIQHTSTAASSRRPFALLGGLAAAGALALAIAIGTGFGFGRPAQGPIAVNPTENPAAGGGVASCLVYDPANLPTFEVVFDGTVTAVERRPGHVRRQRRLEGRQRQRHAHRAGRGSRTRRPVAGLRGRRSVPRDRSRLDDQRLRLHDRLRRRHGGRLGGGLRQLTRPSQFLAARGPVE